MKKALKVFMMAFVFALLFFVVIQGQGHNKSEISTIGNTYDRNGENECVDLT